MKSIRTKITLLTLLAILVSLTIASLLGVIAIRSIARSSSEKMLLLLCETGQKNLDHYFESIEQSVEMVSTFADEDLAEIKELDDKAFDDHMDRTRSMFAKAANKTNGVLTYYYRVDPELPVSNPGFWYTNLDGEGFVEHEVTDISKYDTSDTSQLVWFTVPKNTGESIWLPPYVTDNLDVLVLSYNKPIYRNGEFIGVIGIEIDYSTMANQVDSIDLYDGAGYAFINDSDGYIVYHPHLKEEELEAERGRPTPYGMLEESTLIHYTYDGVEKEAVWLPLSNGMRLNVTVPVSAINAEWHVWLAEIVFVTVVLMVLFIFITMKMAGHVTKPLTDLTAAAEELSAGNYDVSLEHDGDDEVGILTRTFSQLVKHLKTYIRDLNDLAYGDALTAVRNKGAFDKYLQNLQSEIEDPEKENPQFAICFFDCNDLKKINDTYGHEKGDIYLKSACTTICQVFSHSPVFRIGGDEFVAILQRLDYERREELLSVFEQRCFDLRAVNKEPWEKVDVAVGMSVYDPEKDLTADEVFRRADRLMYADKEEYHKRR